MDTENWHQALKNVDASVDVQIWPNENSKDDIELALCWDYPDGELRNYPNLKCICSMGAGVDHLFKDVLLPAGIPLVRISAPSLTQSMYEYLPAVTTYYLREFDVFQKQQEAQNWEPHENQLMSETTVGLMGLGVLGEYAAEKLSLMGFDVIGWSRSKKDIEGVLSFQEDQLDEFIGKSNILICLLPLTEKTRGILNAGLFEKLPSGACLINVARGEHLVEDDLLAALQSGHLRGACLDVFSIEPLPQDHLFWKNKNIIITPHCSSATHPDSVAPQIIRNYRLMQDAKPLINVVDVNRGY